MRTSGWYWVKPRRWVDSAERWQVAEFRAAGKYACWVVARCNKTVHDPDLAEIDERRIVRAA